MEAVTLDEAVPAEHHLAAGIRARLPAVESDRSRVRITVGVSAPAESVTALPGALHEAGSARPRCTCTSTPSATGSGGSRS